MVGIASILPFLAVLANPRGDRDQRPAQRALRRARLREPAPLPGVPRQSRSSAWSSSACCSGPSPTTRSTASSSCAATRSRAGCSPATSASPTAWFLNQHSAQLGANILTDVHKVVGQAMMPAMRLLSHGVVTLTLIGLLVAVQPKAALVLARDARRQLRADLRRGAPPARTPSARRATRPTTRASRRPATRSAASRT